MRKKLFISALFVAILSEMNYGILVNSVFAEEIKSTEDTHKDYINNHKNQEKGEVYGGAINNCDHNKPMGNIYGNFINNSVNGTMVNTMGGAIYNYNSTIGNISGNFINNKAVTTGSSKNAYGGAILNYFNATIDNIKGDFIGNYVSASHGVGSGGAIFNRSSKSGKQKIGDINGSFIGNYAVGYTSASGGAIYSDLGSEIGNITGNFINNYAKSQQQGAKGGGIFNYGAVIGNITSDIVSGNYVETTNTSSNTTSNALGGFLNNTIGHIGNIKGRFIGNHATGSNYAYGGVIFNQGQNGKSAPDSFIENITGDFIGNWVEGKEAKGGAIMNLNGQIGETSKKEEEKEKEKEKEAVNNDVIGGIINSNFIGNYAKTTNTTAQGGAIYTNTDLNIIADNGVSIFSGNYTVDKDGKRTNNAVYMDKDGGTLKLEAKNNGLIIFNDQIDGKNNNGSNSVKNTATTNSGYKVKLTGDNTGNIIINNDILNADEITLEKVTLSLGRDDVFNTTKTFNFEGENNELSMVNGSAGTILVENIGIKGENNVKADFDFSHEIMDRFTTKSKQNSQQEKLLKTSDNSNKNGYNVENNGSGTDSNTKVHVSFLNSLGYTTKSEGKVLFADEEFADKVDYTGSGQLYTPIYIMDVEYSHNTTNGDSKGYFLYRRNDYNPAIFASSIAQQVGAYATQLNVYEHSFEHLKNYMKFTSKERLAAKLSGKYAFISANTTDTEYPIVTKPNQEGLWVSPYVSFENIPLKNGPKVSNINYGTLAGFDTNIEEIKNGYERVITGFVGYTGASQRWQGNESYQNGGLLGSTATFYKNNFYTAITASVGATVGDAVTMYGSEDYSMLVAGIANKTGYDIEFKDGKYIFQPSLLLSYTFVNNFNYTNAAGIRINNEPLHAIQVAPGIKFIINTKNGWQPYLSANFIYNILDQSQVMANEVRLPSISIKPYAQYGIGIQKKIKDEFTAYGQAMVNNGGRNGLSLTFGLRWSFGKNK